VVPEAGQSEKTQRVKGGGLWDSQGLWKMSTGVEDNGFPNQGDMGCVCQRRRSPEVMKKIYVNVGNKGFIQLPNK
jgi:hypothetical protein